MSKNMKKCSVIFVLMLVLACFSHVSAVEAAQIPRLRYSSKVIYIGGDSLSKYTDNCWVPSQNTAGYSVKYEVIKGKDLVTVSSNGKVTATGRGGGESVIKVTFSKARANTITENFTVKVRRNAKTVKLTDSSVKKLDQTLKVGDKVALEAEKSYDGSYEKGYYGLNNYRGVVSDTLKIVSLTPDIISVNGFTITAKAGGTGKIVVKAYQYGDNKYTGVRSVEYTVKVADIGSAETVLLYKVGDNYISLYDGNPAKTFSMMGDDYSQGVAFAGHNRNVDYDAWFNLGNGYAMMSFVIGHLDSYEYMESSLYVYVY